MCRAGGRRCNGSTTSSRATQTARKQRSRARQALRNARATGDENAISQAQQRLDKANAALAAAKTGPCGQTPAGQHGDVTTARALHVPHEEPMSAQPLGGMVSQTELLTYPDGTRLVRKRNGSKAESNGYDPVALTDAEELAPHVLNATGLDYAAVHRNAPNEVLMEHIDGQNGADIVGWGGTVPDEHRNSADGQRLGLADHLMANTDRNDENWIRTPDGRLVGIDHGNAFEDTQHTSSPFADGLYDRSGPTPTARPNNFTKSDMDTVHSRLQALRPEFEKRGRADWHDAMMHRHHDVAARAAGTTSLIAEPDKESHVPGHKNNDEESSPQQQRTGDSAGRRWDVTNIVHGKVNGFQTDVINGGLTFRAGQGFTIGDNPSQHDRPTDLDRHPRVDRDATARRRRAMEKAARSDEHGQQATGADTGRGPAVHTGPRDSATGGTGPVTIADDNGNPLIQAGNVSGAIRVNGKRLN